MNFINLPRGRRLVPVPAVGARLDSLSATYHSGLDVTAAEVPLDGRELSLIFILPGKQAEFIAGGLGKLEHKLDIDNWNSLMRSFYPVKADIKFPLFGHRSTVELKDNFASMGVKTAFTKREADFSGVNGGRDLFLTSFQQVAEFVVNGTARDDGYGTSRRGSRNKRSPWRLFSTASRKRPRRKNRQQEGAEHHEHHNHGAVEHDHNDHHQHHNHEAEEGGDHTYRLHFNRQFLYVLRHNPTGLILFVGRYYQPDEASSSSHSHHGHHAEGHGHHEH